MTTVIKVDDPKVRALVELYTERYCKPDQIKFVLDGAGNWIMSVENMSNPKYINPDPNITAGFTSEHNTTKPFKNLVEVIEQYGVEIEYIPFAE
jgi:hypothetical protein